MPLPTVVLSSWNSREIGWRCSMSQERATTTIQIFGMKRRVKKRIR